MRYRHQQKGFVAVLSVIIISAVLLVLVYTLGISSFFNRFNVLDAENKRISLGLAEACVNVAMIRSAQDSGYRVTTPAPVDTGESVCMICSVSAGFPKTIETRAEYNGAYSNLAVEIAQGSGNFIVNSWQETQEATDALECAIP